MYKQQKPNAPKIRNTIKGMSTQTFVKGYKGPAQMNTNTISGMNLSSRGNRIMQSIYEAIGKR